MKKKLFAVALAMMLFASFVPANIAFASVTANVTVVATPSVTQVAVSDQDITVTYTVKANISDGVSVGSYDMDISWDENMEFVSASKSSRSEFYPDAESYNSTTHHYGGALMTPDTGNNNTLFTITLKIKAGESGEFGISIGNIAIGAADGETELSSGVSVTKVNVTCPHTSKTEVTAKESTCLEYGNNKYYVCDCGVVLKADGVTETTVAAETLTQLADHKGGVATCTQQAVCAVCEEPYGALAAHEYKTEWNKGDATGHWHDCKNCTAHDTPVAHTPDRAEATEEYPVLCTVCYYEIAPIKDHVHEIQETVTAKPASCTEVGNIAYYVCRCDKWFFDSQLTAEISDRDSVVISALGHDMAAATCTSLSTCKRDNCGYTEGAALGHDMAEATCTSPSTCKRDNCSHTEGAALGHESEGDWLYDKVSHWKVCDRCTDNVEVGTHTKSDDYVEEGYDRIYTCTVCNCEIRETIHTHSYTGHAYNNHYHWKECECGDVKDVATHGWFRAGVIKQPTETETGLERYVCTCGAYKDVVLETLTHIHVAGQSWESDGSVHWNECACGEPMNAELHTWGEGVEKDGELVYTCTVCGAEKSEDLPVHVHDGGSVYKHDDLTHWQECTCGEKIGEGAHVWVTDRVEDGVIYSKCALCGAAVDAPDKVDSLDDAPAQTSWVYAAGLLMTFALGISLLSINVKQR